MLGPVGMMMAVAFERYGRLYYLDPGPFSPAVGDRVLVPTEAGPEVAECVWAPQWVGEEIEGLPECAGIATRADLERDERNRRLRAAARAAAKRLVKSRGLSMKVVAVDYVDVPGPDASEGSGPTYTVYFSAPGRVEFRELLRELSDRLRARVRLRRVNARDEARLQGGIGPCGRDLCCATFLKDFEPVSVRMARDQGLHTNPMRIAGACGKLMCCLKYEHPLYQEFRATAPRRGTEVDTPEGAGVVVGHNVPADRVVVRLGAGGAKVACDRASVCGPRRAHDGLDEGAPEPAGGADGSGSGCA